MLKWRIMGRSGAVGAVALAGLLSSCGYAKRSDVESQLAELRQEMRAGDDALGGRIDTLEGRTAALERDLAALRSDFDVKMKQLEGAIAFAMPVYFDFAKSEVRAADRAVLDRFAAVAKTYYPDAVVTVEGFTDPAGSRAYNQRLGKARAEAVRGYLTTQGGLSAERVRAVSYGEDQSRLLQVGARGPGESGRVNRRVVLVIEGPAAGSTAVASGAS